MSFETIELNAARICDGLRKIGYTPPTAITDIVDNSVEAGAQNIYVLVQPIVASDAKRDNVRAYLIIDDGRGMTAQDIKDALRLGATDENYRPNSLSKFGLGLKSAAFSQGEKLEIVSSPGDQEFQKYTVSLPVIRERGVYGAMKEVLTDEDELLIKTYLPNGRGTIVRIASVRANNHPSIRSTLKELQIKIGVIYYYMMQDSNLQIYLVDINEEKQQCKPYDVLFTQEANENGDLDENTWDGKKTMWIQRQKELTIDPADNIKAKVEVTQLPYPPIFENQIDIRNRYMIGAGNYGYYVYRNKRLLSWAESFGIIPQDQDFYAFRGRILIDGSADEVFNIDVKKSQLHPSETAYNALDDLADRHKRKSKKAWSNANAERLRLLNADSSGRANEIVESLDIPQELPGLMVSASDYKEIEERQKEIEREQKVKAKKIAQMNYSENPELSENAPNDLEQLTEKQIEEGVLAEGAKKDDRIHMVSNTQDNVLWEPFFFADKDCVRINKLHRFSRLIYEDNKNNSALTILFNLMLLYLSISEFYVLSKFKKHPRSVTEEILCEYRRVVTEYLAHLLRESGDKLPTE